MECTVYRKRENSRTRCRNGHYVCNECHMKGMDVLIVLIGLCLKERSKNQHWNVCLYSFKIHTADKRAFCTLSSYDCQSIGGNWTDRRSPVL